MYQLFQVDKKHRSIRFIFYFVCTTHSVIVGHTSFQLRPSVHPSAPCGWSWSLEGARRRGRPRSLGGARRWNRSTAASSAVAAVDFAAVKPHVLHLDSWPLPAKHTKGCLTSMDSRLLASVDAVLCVWAAVCWLVHVQAIGAFSV